MRLYIAACGMGLGHASRCLALAEEARRRGIEVTFSTYAGEAARLLKSRGFEAYEAPSLSYLLNGEGDLDFKLTLAKGPLELRKLAVHVALEAKYLKRAEPDVVISDSRLSTVIAAKLLGLPSALIINQLKLIIPRRRPIGGAKLSLKLGVERLGCEVLSVAWSQSSRILIPDFPPPLTISTDNLYIPRRLKDKVKLVGPLLGEELRGLEGKEEAKRRVGVEGPLVLMLAGGLREERLKLLRAMVSGFSDVQGLLVLASASLPGRRGLLLKRGGLRVYAWLPERGSLLKAADVLVTHGGHTSIAEAMCTATPMVIAPLKGHTERLGNARAMERLGVARVVDLERQGAEGLREAVLEVMKDDSYRARAEEVAREALRYWGVDEAMREAVELAGASLH
jgi:UDP:flavonoid glycosyltransferase YjiC (YdhE family)